MSATHGCVDIEGLDDRFHGHGGCGFVMGVSALGGDTGGKLSLRATVPSDQGTFTDSRRSAGALTAAVRSSLSQANFCPSAARLRVFSSTTENNWR